MTEPLRDDGWTEAEWQVYVTCREFRPQRRPRPIDEAAALIGVLRAVYERNHGPEARQLKKSELLTRGLRLLRKEELYPLDDGGTWLLEARLELCFEILLDCPQRPVLEACALVALEQELEESWSERFPALTEQVAMLVGLARSQVLPLVVLLVQVDDAKGRQALDALRSAPLDDKRLRLVELLGILATWPDARSLEPMVRALLMPIFGGVGVVQRGNLVGRLFRELDKQPDLTSNDRFRLVLDPILADNPRTHAVLRHLFDLMESRGEAGRPYLLHYADRMREIDEDVHEEFFAYAQAHGTVHFVGRLRPYAEERAAFGFFRTPRSRRAQAAINAILDREGVAGSVGGLSIVEAEGGAISLAADTNGALAVEEISDD